MYSVQAILAPPPLSQLPSDWLPLTSRRFKQMVGVASLAEVTIIGLSLLLSLIIRILEWKILSEDYLMTSDL